MKCMHCGAETEDQRFCIYCGQPLQKNGSGVHAKKASRKISGVMRMRRHAAVSQSSLPEVLKEGGRLDLSAMDSDPSNEAIHTSDTEVKATMNDQSRELESLLLKLNEKHNSSTDISETDLSEENLLDDSVETEVETETETDVKTEVSEKEEPHTSGPIPVGSGSFARVPSGGFHPIVETVKSACSGMLKRIKTIPSKIHFTSRKAKSSEENTKVSKPSDTKVSKSSEENKRISDESLQIEKERKKFIISSVVAAIAVIALLIIIVKHDREETDYNAIAAQTMGDNDYAFNGMEQDNQDITTLTFDGENFVVPDIFNGGGQEVKEPVAQAPVPVQPVVAPQPVAQNQPVAAVVPQDPGKSRLSEPRTYGSKDNVMAVPTDGQVFKTNKQCLMREGPASRFGLVKNIPQGTNIKILTKTEEDWLLNGNVWTKEGYPSKLGPGSQFDNAVKGAGVPLAKGRVISANNWRYVQVGDTYGYIGPVCFK